MATSAPARSTPSRPACDLFKGITISHVEILGILSLIFWSLVLIVTVKYVILVMRADNRGEGGILALMALAQRVSVGTGDAQLPRAGRHRRRLPVLRRRRHHAGDLGAVGGRGAGSVGARPARIRAADQPGGDRRCCSPCNIAAPTASAGCSARSWRCGSSSSALLGAGRDRAAPVRAAGDFAELRGRAVHAIQGARVRRARRGGAVRHRRRGAVCRHGPFRRRIRSG